MPSTASARQLWVLLALLLAVHSLVVSALVQEPDQTLNVLLVWGGALLAWEAPSPRWQPHPSRLSLALGVAALLLVLWRGQQFLTLDLAASLLPLLAGFSLLLLATGPRHSAHLRPSLLILALLPLVQSLTPRLPTLPLSLLTARLSQGLLLLAGLPAQLHHNVVSINGGGVEVIGPCAGQSILSQLLLVALIFAVAFPLRRRWHNGLMLLLAAPLAVLTNALRIAILTLLAASGGPVAYWWFDVLHKHQGSVLFGGLGVLIFAGLYERWLTLQVRRLQR